MKVQAKDVRTMAIAIIILFVFLPIKSALAGIGVLYLVMLAYITIAKRQQRKDAKVIDSLVKTVTDGIEESVRETRLLQTNPMPTDEDILLYYKMYCKKIELKKMNEWTTEVPIPFDDWKQKATTELDTYGGYRFMIPLTSDAMIGFPPNVTFHRYTNYKAMVQGEENAS